MLALYLALSSRDRAGRALGSRHSPRASRRAPLTAPAGRSWPPPQPLPRPPPRTDSSGARGSDGVLVVAAGLLFPASRHQGAGRLADFVRGLRTGSGSVEGQRERYTRASIRRTSLQWECSATTRSLVSVPQLPAPLPGLLTGNRARPAPGAARSTQPLPGGFCRDRHRGSIGVPGRVVAGLRGAWRARQRLARRDALLAEGIFVALMSFLVAGLFLHASSCYLWIVIGFGFVAGNLARGTARDPGFGTSPKTGGPRGSAAVPSGRAS